MTVTPNTYTVGKADGIFRIFHMREGKRLGIKCKTYWSSATRSCGSNTPASSEERGAEGPCCGSTGP